MGDQAKKRRTKRRVPYRLHEGAAKAHVSDQVMRRLLLSGKVLGWKVGHEWRLDPDSVDAVARGDVDEQAA